MPGSRPSSSGSKKGGGKKKKASSAAAKPPAPVAPPSLPAGPPRKPTVSIKFEMLNWRFGCFAKDFPTETTLVAALKTEIIQKHGRMQRLNLWVNSVSDETLLGPEYDYKTLAEIGIPGALPGPGTPKPLVTLFFDFVPHGHDDPILAATHRRLAGQ